ncbi:efflux RND transporter periplasmic adaptor subunit [Paludibacter sp.]|uniref:efflux RND transporter periplasmic adaptor subunit n=1 Tax=Paludibacter sp. TaxID=1898105 RepID=UPI001354D181|nr:efflux RND transporter periplasmic adaptor subunit [Paludibacter sp.]MTK54306.1 efflux RND transporter periplasmic adaptor subunit [Paludibacter sp.]
MKQYDNRLSFISLSFLLVFVGIFVSCQSKKTDKEKKGPSKYQVASITRGDATVFTSFATQIESENTVDIYSRANGYIERIYVKEGDNVRKGSPILKISDADYRQTVNSTKAAYDNAQLEVRKLQPLVDKGIISPYQLQTAQSNLQAARAAYENARINLGYTVIKSPVSGVVGRITLKPGSLVTAGLADPITTVASSGDVFAYFSFDEKKLIQLCNNASGTLKQKVAKLPPVELILADGQKYEYKGKLELGSSIVDQTTGSLQMKAVFPNPHALLHTGTSGTVIVPTFYTNVLLVPQKATYEIQDKKMVFVVDPHGIIHATNITVANATSDQYVVEDGVNVGDKIVVDGLNRLKDGDKIIPVSAHDRNKGAKRTAAPKK